MAFVYILESIKDGTYYVGSAEDVSARLAQHNRGHVQSTKARRPWKLRFAKEYATVAEARRFEGKIKSWKKRAAIENFMNRESSMSKVGP
ncbi:hypothetical protein A3A39_02690 [Candidatus Kaiserbacteria bacterium RIFCSPLOWO2_01_FULL_54_13]|uniref:GIY-YIG domain-containing protein n=1 Tax=Candidatus Kaiserbacteria bacterium RIFCSPLOWO2_01_FULL_54_13 TaxID=1798512 RepID=A0A1F6F3H8_9BACT|nr:MAG: hypothetical protein A3A39_02690 [Candidatus Kaiserbacteria bacterium RIFCSPLOWO2_01_FULL_54_13]